MFAITANNTSRFRRLAKEGSWIVIGQIAVVAGALVLVRVLTEYLDPEQYGQLALGLTVAGLVNQVVMGGIGAGIGRFYSIAAEKQDLGGYLNATRHLLAYATVAVVVIGLILIASLYWLGYSQWIGLTAAALVFSVLSGYNSTLNGIQNAARQRSIVALHGGMDAWLKIGLAVGVMFWLGTSSMAVVIGYACSSLLVMASQFFFLKRFLPVNANENATSTKEIWSNQMWLYAWPFSVWGIFSWLQTSTSRWAIEHFESFNEVGLFQVLSQLSSPIQLVVSMTLAFVSPILFSRTGNACNVSKIYSARRITNKLALFGIIITLLLCIFVVMFHSQIFYLFAGEKYRTQSFMSPWLVLSAGLLGISQIFCMQLFSELRTAEIRNVGVITAIFGAAANYVGVFLYGIHGAIYAQVLYALFNSIWLFKLTFIVKIKS